MATERGRFILWLQEHVGRDDRGRGLAAAERIVTMELAVEEPPVMKPQIEAGLG